MLPRKKSFRIKLWVFCPSRNTEILPVRLPVGVEVKSRPGKHNPGG